MKKKIIIHCDGVHEEEAIAKVQAVIEGGKISGGGKSYCYVTRWADRIVSTREPRKDSPNTYTFYVYTERRYGVYGKEDI